MDSSRLFPEKPIIGMIHMPPLPGAPGNRQSINQLTDFALSESDKLEGAGLDACTLENVGDTPLFKEHPPALSRQRLRSRKQSSTTPK